MSEDIEVLCAELFVTEQNFNVLHHRVFKGAPAGRTARLFSENSSAGCPLDPHVTYLLFIDDSKDGFYVDNCGWSGPVADRETGAVLHRVKAIAAHARSK